MPLKKMEREKTRGAVRFPREVKKILQTALALRDAKPTLTERQFEVYLGKLERRLDALIAEDRNFSDSDNARFALKSRRTLSKYHIGVQANNRGREAPADAGFSQKSSILSDRRRGRGIYRSARCGNYQAGAAAASSLPQYRLRNARAQRTFLAVSSHHGKSNLRPVRATSTPGQARLYPRLRLC